MASTSTPFRLLDLPLELQLKVMYEVDIPADFVNLLLTHHSLYDLAKQYPSVIEAQKGTLKWVRYFKGFETDGYPPLSFGHWNPFNRLLHIAEYPRGAHSIKELDIIASDWTWDGTLYTSIGEDAKRLNNNKLLHGCPFVWRYLRNVQNATRRNKQNFWAANNTLLYSGIDGPPGPNPARALISEDDIFITNFTRAFVVFCLGMVLSLQPLDGLEHLIIYDTAMFLRVLSLVFGGSGRHLRLPRRISRLTIRDSKSGSAQHRCWNINISRRNHDQLAPRQIYHGDFAMIVSNLPIVELDIDLRHLKFSDDYWADDKSGRNPWRRVEKLTLRNHVPIAGHPLNEWLGQFTRLKHLTLGIFPRFSGTTEHGPVFLGDKIKQKLRSLVVESSRALHQDFDNRNLTLNYFKTPTVTINVFLLDSWLHDELVYARDHDVSIEWEQIPDKEPGKLGIRRHRDFGGRTTPFPSRVTSLTLPCPEDVYEDLYDRIKASVPQGCKRVILDISSDSRLSADDAYWYYLLQASFRQNEWSATRNFELLSVRLLVPFLRPIFEDLGIGLFAARGLVAVHQRCAATHRPPLNPPVVSWFAKPELKVQRDEASAPQ
ncbi:hypothetical protein BT63DRAFT_444107 [Microthyrium microscopicum]|uniref:Uncharacterized protein n=1 Tax=Microthyrium microscopicum TaxID=703497 RepID=A0A6A6TZT1_9PEZI|nr:hypothetical protein BT63DRAFT_444107 [Microthyrium microscopicum]